MRKLILFLLVSVILTMSVSANTVESSTMYFEGPLTINPLGGFTGTIPAIAGTFYMPGGDGELIWDNGGFDVYAQEGGTAYVEGIGSYPIGADNDAYSTSGPWGTWYDPDVADYYEYSLEFTSNHWYLRYSSGESPMSGIMYWNNMYAVESDLGTQDGGHDGSAIHGGGAQAWDWDNGWGVEVIPLEYLGFDVEITDLGEGVYRVALIPAPAPANPVIVGTGFGFDLDINPGESCPVIDQSSVDYFVHTWMDETPESFGGLFAGLGYEDLLDIAFAAGWAGRSYAFDGELITFVFNATDSDGIDCVDGFIILENDVESRVVQCAKNITSEDTATFICKYYVEDAETRNGEHWVSVEVEDNCGDGCKDTVPGSFLIYLNPAVGLSMKTQETQDFVFAYDEAGDVLARIENSELVIGPRPGDTVYTPWFAIENSADADTGLYILLQLYGTDFRSDPESEIVPLCPGNRLEIDNMEYIARHLNVEQPWTTMPDGTNYGALDADYIFTNWDLDEDFNGAANFLGVGDDISMRLRLLIPDPCKGEFNLGGDVIFVGRVI